MLRRGLHKLCSRLHLNQTEGESEDYVMEWRLGRAGRGEAGWGKSKRGPRGGVLWTGAHHEPNKATSRTTLTYCCGPSPPRQHANQPHSQASGQRLLEAPGSGAPFLPVTVTNSIITRGSS